MPPTPIHERYVAVLNVPSGSRLFCSDQYRDEWTGNFGFAESFPALYDAVAVAQRHGGQAMLWREAQGFAGVAS